MWVKVPTCVGKGAYMWVKVPTCVGKGAYMWVKVPTGGLRCLHV